jgi:hypothetical protein
MKLLKNMHKVNPGYVKRRGLMPECTGVRNAGISKEFSRQAAILLAEIIAHEEMYIGYPPDGVGVFGLFASGLHAG